jgi:putative FmdB family regulatory protein
MPLYDYSCNECGFTVEKSRSIAKRDVPVKCSECGSATSRGVGCGKFMLIGGGWTGNAHPIIIPPMSNQEAVKEPPINYYNCTPESVHRGMTERLTHPEQRS